MLRILNIDVLLFELKHFVVLLLDMVNIEFVPFPTTVRDCEVRKGVIQYAQSLMEHK